MIKKNSTDSAIGKKASAKTKSAVEADKIYSFDSVGAQKNENHKIDSYDPGTRGYPPETSASMTH